MLSKQNSNYYYYDYLKKNKHMKKILNLFARFFFAIFKDIKKFKVLK